MTIKRDRLYAIGIVLAALALAALWLPVRTHIPFDDTFITFRYAANLAHGCGIVWNPGGPPTEGYTNFLLVLLLAPFSAMGLDMVVATQAIGVIAVIVSAVTMRRLIGQIGLIGPISPMSRPYILASWLAVILFLLDPFTWFNAYSGMETSLFTMWLLLVVATWNQPKLPFIFATLAALTRPEGAMMGGILLLVKYWQFKVANRTDRSDRTDKSALTAAIVFFILPLLLYASWKLYYFGNLLPNSFYVKVAQPRGLAGAWPLFVFYRGTAYLVLLAMIGLAVQLRGGIRMKSRASQIMVLWTVLLSSFYLGSQLLMNFYDRFTNSIEVMLIVGAASGYAVLASGRWHKIFRHPVSITVLLAFHVFWSWQVRGEINLTTLADSVSRRLLSRPGIQPIAQPQPSKPEQSYIDRCTDLAMVFHSIPDHELITFMWSDAGVMPYYSGMKHLDPVGLNTTAIAHAKTWQEVNRIIARARPDIILMPLNNRPAFLHDSCRYIFRGGHGLIGKGYPTLMQEPELQSYRAVALFTNGVYDLDIFVDTLSPHYRQIDSVLSQHYPKPPSCIR